MEAQSLDAQGVLDHAKSLSDADRADWIRADLLTHEPDWAVARELIRLSGNHEGAWLFTAEYLGAAAATYALPPDIATFVAGRAPEVLETGDARHDPSDEDFAAVALHGQLLGKAIRKFVEGRPKLTAELTPLATECSALTSKKEDLRPADVGKRLDPVLAMIESEVVRLLNLAAGAVTMSLDRRMAALNLGAAARRFLHSLEYVTTDPKTGIRIGYVDVQERIEAVYKKVDDSMSILEASERVMQSAAASSQIGHGHGTAS